jgi:hypothetical protein
VSTQAVPPIPERAGKRSASLPRTGKTGFSAAVSEALEQWLAMAKLREVIEADEREFGPVGDEALRPAEAEW